jgi:predicted nucleic acid-binding Zn ribbon protein
MRGRRRTAAATLAELLARRPEARAAALAAAFAEACGPRLAREASLRGTLRDGRLLVLARSEAWAAQLAALEPEICARINARLGGDAARALEIRIGPGR